ncbi:MAG: hypothetical protein RDV48_23770 [Candidatus Eremiobacteraeota bacterium]|nr:hypothetical protein [Candidatus Eremiobacteraeota bacterium]
MSDIKSRKLIVIKGFLFLLIGLTASLYIIWLTRSLLIAFLLVTGIWAFCRFYYFLFYVLERYAGVEGRYAGIGDLVLRLMRKS